MKVLLVNPPYSLEERYGKKLKHFGGCAEPLGLAYLAASARNAGYEVEIIDAPIQNHTPVSIARKVKDEKIGLVGITMLTPMYGRAKTTVQSIKKDSPDSVVVLGGAHPTALPEETLLDIKSDIVVIGEGENTFVELIRTVDKGTDLSKVKGICYRESGRVDRTDHREFEKNLDKFPVPARDLLPMEKYFITATRVKGSGYCRTVIAARGCPFKCAYCSHPFGRTFRAHSPERIVTEMEELVSKYNAKEINIEADTLTINKSFMLSLCDALIKSGLSKKINWTCEARADVIDEEKLRKMKEAGCWQISVGVESGVDRLLKEIDKGETTAQIAKKIELIHKVGITTRSFFMLGLPTETHLDSMRTIEFAKKLNSDWAQFTVLIPYPGTPLFGKLKARGEIRSVNWDDYKTWGGWSDSNLPYVTEGRTEEELKYLQQYAMRRYYLRPRAVWKHLKNLTSLSKLKNYLIGLSILLQIRKK
ncbi:MAG: B12-binding domain-containing radical SAM protein [Candidatus Hodarchaeota archaeon]